MLIAEVRITNDAADIFKEPHSTTLSTLGKVLGHKYAAFLHHKLTPVEFSGDDLETHIVFAESFHYPRGDSRFHVTRKSLYCGVILYHTSYNIKELKRYMYHSLKTVYSCSYYCIEL